MCIELRRGHTSLICPHYTVVALLRCPNIRFSSTPRAACPPESRDAYLALRTHGEMCDCCYANGGEGMDLTAFAGMEGVSGMGLGAQGQCAGQSGGFQEWRVAGGMQGQHAAELMGTEGVGAGVESSAGGMVPDELEEVIRGAVDEGLVLGAGQTVSRPP